MDEKLLLIFLVIMLLLTLVLIKREDEGYYFDPKDNSPFNVAPKFWCFNKIKSL